jgi:pyrophosphatase PpaX
MPRRDAALFDLDGTVLDTGELILSSWRHVRDTFGLRGDDDDFRRGMGRPLREIFGAWTRDEAERDRLVDAYREHNMAVHDQMVRPFPGIPELFAALRAEGIRVGIVTSKARAAAEQGLRVTGLAVDDLVGPEDVIHPKPDPEPVRLALARLAVTAGRAIFVGDSPHDIHAGRAAGVATAAVRWGMFAVNELEASAPDHWLADPADLLALVR